MHAHDGSAHDDGRWGVDTIEYGAIPEPATGAMSALLGAMALGTTLWRRRALDS